MNSPHRNRYGLLYDAAALRGAVERRGITLRALSRSCGRGDQDVKNWLYPPEGHRMQWKTMRRLRTALNLTEDEARQIWKRGGEDEGQC